MAWSLSVASILGVAAAVISGTVALYAWRHREKRMALQFVVLEVTLAAWSLAYAVQIGYGTLSEQRLWQGVSLGIAGFVPTVWLLFTFAYTNRETWLSRNRVALLTAEPLVWLLLSLTNPVHELVWTDAVLTATILGPVTALEFGLGYAIHITYAYGVVALGIGLLVLHATKVARAYQKQAGLLVVAVVPPFLSHISFTLGRSPIPSLDLTPFAFAFTGIVFGLALFKFDLLQLSPIAREQAFYEGGDGLVIVNSDGEIIDVIGIATEVLDPKPHIGGSISSVFPDVSVGELDGSEVTVTHDGDRRVYQYQVSALSAHHDQQVGTLIIMRDITGLRESEQQLSVTNRVLRHNLRNDMNVVLGYASELESRLDGEDAHEAQKIRETVEQFLELTKKAEQIAQLDGHSEADAATVDIVKQLRNVAAEQKTSHPEVQFTLDTPPETRVDGVDPETLRLAVQNLVENAIVHNDSETPHVTIAIEEAPEETRIKISDNGPGIPEIEQKAIGSNTETPLGHSQGLGLWLTYWCATRWGGDLRFETDPEERGATVTLAIPKTSAPTPADATRTDTSTQ